MNYAVLIAFQLNGAANQYAGFHAALNASYYRWQYLPSTWVVYGPKSALEWQNELVPLIRKGDNLLILDVDIRAVQGFLTQPAFDWFKGITKPR